LHLAHPRVDTPVVTEPDERERFRSLPEPVRLEDTVESVDVADGPAPEAADERARLLREAGG
jgi:hypothetical protein